MSSVHPESMLSSRSEGSSAKVKRRREGERLPSDMSLSTPSSSVSVLRSAPFFFYTDRSHEPDDDPSVPIVPLGRHVNLPGKLHVILNRPDFNAIISWMPHGRSWKIHDTPEFKSVVMPQFWGKCSWSSFLRQVRFWGFVRLNKGKDKGSYYHEYFLRGLPHLCKRMERLDQKESEASDTSISSRHDKRECEPDLYAINEIHPLELVPTNSYHMDMLESTMAAGPSARMALTHERAVNVGDGEEEDELLDIVGDIPVSCYDAISDHDAPFIDSDVQVETSRQKRHHSPILEQQREVTHVITTTPVQSSTILTESQQTQPQIQSEGQPIYDTEMNDLVQRQQHLLRWQAFLLPFLQLGVGSASTLRWITQWWVQQGTVPTFTEEDELRERQSSSPQEQLEARANVVRLFTEDFSAENLVALSLLHEEIDEYPPNEKAELVEACTKCPGLTNDDWDLLFLLSEKFDAKAAAKRMIAYWKLRVDTLGSDLAFLPLTIENTFSDDLHLYHLELGLGRIMPVSDTYGRSILLMSPGRIHGKDYNCDIMKRTFLYMCQAVSERPDTAKNGVVVIFNLSRTSKGDTNMELIMHLIHTLNCFPFDIKAMHFCQFYKFHQKLFFPIGKYLLSSFLRRRIEMHTEVGRDLLDKFRQFGLPPERLPTDLGGMIELDHEKWVSNRIENGL